MPLQIPETIHGEEELGLITRAVRAEEGSSSVGGREEQHRAGHVSSMLTAKPLFILGRRKHTDVAAREGQVVSAVSYKEVLVSAGSEKEGKKEVMGATDEKILRLAQ